jgi:2-amino-4-hydroxy-6-hydroxymethyldihydropteridine diphosphokinase
MGAGEGSVGRAVAAGDPEADGAAVVALGSNLGGALGSSRAVLEEALERFAAAGLKLKRRSSWWRSAAWPDPTQPDYLNGVALVETSLPPAEALRALHRIEAEFGRRRGERNAARTLDLDLIAYGRLVVDAPGLRLPHPRAAERLFVMGPLAEIAPGWRHPVTGETAADLAPRASVGADARPEMRP